VNVFLASECVHTPTAQASRRPGGVGRLYDAKGTVVGRVLSWLNGGSMQRWGQWTVAPSTVHCPLPSHGVRYVMHGIWIGGRAERGAEPAFAI
jgi:hypothetical protein